jgi:hypothetical protein
MVTRGGPARESLTRSASRAVAVPATPSACGPARGTGAPVSRGISWATLTAEFQAKGHARSVVAIIVYDERG